MDQYSGNSFGNSADPFTKFWTDCVSKMTGAGFAAPPQYLSDESIKQMRKAFFDAWASHCDEFMRSPAFLEGMKKTMDASLAFREQLNEFMTRALHESQVPARSDTDSIMLVLRSLEERVLSRLDRLEECVETLSSAAVDSSGEKVEKPAKTAHERRPVAGGKKRG